MLRHLRRSPWLGVSLAAGAIVAGWLYRYVTTQEETKEEKPVVNQDDTAAAATPTAATAAAEETPAPAAPEQGVEEQPPAEDAKKAERDASWGAQWFQMYRDATTADETGPPPRQQAPQATPGGSWQLPMSPAVLHDPQPSVGMGGNHSRLADPIVLNDYNPNPVTLSSQPAVNSMAPATGAGGFHLPPVPDSVSVLKQS